MFKKILPKFSKVARLSLASLVMVWMLVGVAVPVRQVSAATTLATASPVPGQWVDDSEVNFAGKNAKRSGDVLDWVIAHSEWSYIADGTENPFTKVWIGVRNIVYALVLLTIIVASFVIIVTRGQNIGVRKFVVRLIIVVALITLSFSIVQFFYQIVDIIQEFFLRRGSGFIQSKDLLSVSFDYASFNGMRRFGPEYDESATISLILVKLTAASYYAMFIILMIRKIILWFFIVVSPIFALLFLFTTLRNTGKIWVGEFFRWLLYGPLFAVLLSGLVTFWQGWGPGAPVRFDGQGFQITNEPINPSYILPCDKDQVVTEKNADGSPKKSEKIKDIIQYPTGIDILIGGPCQTVSEFNNVNTPATFIQYVIALLMIWMVILMPWILLKIFLDYLNNFSYSESGLAKYVAAARSSPLLERYRFGPAGTPPPRGPQQGAPAGLARAIPEAETQKAAALPVNISENVSVAEQAAQNAGTVIDAELARSLAANVAKSEGQFNQATQSAATSVFNQASQAAQQDLTSAISSSQTAVSGELSQILSQANLSIPKMADIAKFESALLASDAQTRSQATKVYEALNRIAGVSSLTTPVEREQYTKVSEKLMEQSAEGNPVATAVLSATNALTQGTTGKITVEPKVVIKDSKSMAKISSVAAVPDMSVSAKFDQVYSSLSEESKNNNVIAQAVLSQASAVAQNSANVPSLEQAQTDFLNRYQSVAQITQIANASDLNDDQKVSQIAGALEQQARAGNNLASAILASMGASPAGGPKVNQLSKIVVKNYQSVAKALDVNQLPGLDISAKFGKLQEALLGESKAGNPVATALVSVSPSSGPSSGPDAQIAQKQYLNHYEAVAKVTQIADSANITDQQKLYQIGEELSKQAKEGNPLAVSLISIIKLTTQAQIPETNTVQQVNLDDYEQVKKTWTENYRNLEVPADVNNNPRTRKEWLEQETAQIPQAINLLNSTDQYAQQQGRQMVSKILPFLLLGGFSKPEIAAYLKAKQEAAKAVLGEVNKASSEDELLERQKAAAKPKALTMEANPDEPKTPPVIPAEDKK